MHLASWQEKSVIVVMIVLAGVTQAATEKALKELKQLEKEREELVQSVHSMEASHRVAQKALSAAEQSARQELHDKTEELQATLPLPHHHDAKCGTVSC
jgi:hypothetical protein